VAILKLRLGSKLTREEPDISNENISSSGGSLWLKAEEDINQRNQ